MEKWVQTMSGKLIEQSLIRMQTHDYRLLDKLSEQDTFIPKMLEQAHC